MTKVQEKNIDELLKLVQMIQFSDNNNPDYETTSIYCKRFKVSKVPSLEEISEVEKLLKVKLPKSYVNFITKSTWYSPGNACNYIVAPFEIDNPEHFILPDIITINKEVRRLSFYQNCIGEDCDSPDFEQYKIPDYLIIFDSSNSGDDDYVCFDIRYPDKDGEYPVITWGACDYAALYDKFKNKTTNILGTFDNLNCTSSNFSTYMYKKIVESINI